MTVLFIDSGIGGISTLASTCKLIPNLNFIYFADDKFAPYGTKSKTFIKQRLKAIISKYNSKIDMVVLACNTATTVAIEYLRKCFSCPIVGTEPAIKLASNNLCQVVVLATPLTAKSKRIQSLKSNSCCNVKILPLKSLASNIDSYFLNGDSIAKTQINKTIMGVKKKIQLPACLVLGCTHYCLIKDKISSLFNLPVYDGNFGVAKQICRLIKTDNGSNQPKQQFICSSKKPKLVQKYKKIFEQTLANSLNL